MKHRNTQDAIRLVTVLLYILFLTPGFLFSRRGHFPRSDFALFLIMGFVMLLYAGIEAGEFIRASYRYRNANVPQILFFGRILLLALPYIFLPVISHTIGPVSSRFIRYTMPGHTTMLLSLIPFYAHFAFQKKYGVLSLFIALVLPICFEILVRQPESWDANVLGFLTYRTLTILFFYVLATLLAAERFRTEENRRLLEQLKASESQLRDYAGKVAHTVALEERTRLARDIHDSLGHALTAIKIQLSKAEAYHEVNPEESLTAVRAAKDTAEDAMKDVRDSLGRLNGEGAAVSLATGLPRLVKQLKDSGIEVEYTYNGKEDGFNYSVLMGFFRFAQEGVTNILKHASATKASLNVIFGADEGKIELIDNGTGFHVPQKNTDPKENKYGLWGLRRRLELVRGILEIESEPGKGTRLYAIAPRDPVALISEERRS